MAKKKSAGTAATRTDPNVDQIREIIFGANIREYEARFKALQEEFAAAFKKLKEEINQRLKTLETAIEQDREALKAESLARDNADESLDGLVQHQAAELGKEIDAAESRVSQTLAKLAKDAQAEHKEIRQSMRGGNRDLDARLTQVAAELTDRKVAREELAGMLEELARRLSGTAEDSKE